MTEMLAKPLDPIYDVCSRMEDSYTETYYNPANGDWMSDDYLRIIELTTQPDPLSKDELIKLERSIKRLNAKYSLIQEMLGESSLRGAYDDVAAQVSAIIDANSRQDSISLMQSAPVDVPARIVHIISQRAAPDISVLKSQ